MNNYLGTTYNKQRRFKASKETFLKAIAIAQKAENLEEDQLGRIYHNAAYNYLDMHDLENATSSIQNAINIFKQFKDDENLALAYQTAGHIYIEQNKTEDAIIFWKSAISLFIQHDDQLNTAISYQNLGHIFADHNQPEDALIYLERAKTIYHNIGEKHLLAQAYHNIGALHHKNSGNMDQARQNLNLAADLYKAVEDHYQLGRIQNLLGHLALEEQAYTAALTFFKESIKLFTKTEAENDLVAARHALAGTYFQLSNYEEAAYWIQLVIDDYIKQERLLSLANARVSLGWILFFLDQDVEGLRSALMGWKVSESDEEARNFIHEGTLSFLRAVNLPKDTIRIARELQIEDLPTDLF